MMKFGFYRGDAEDAENSNLLLIRDGIEMQVRRCNSPMRNEGTPTLALPRNTEGGEKRGLFCGVRQSKMH